jgi:M6 family metalloprotease-like protein
MPMPQIPGRRAALAIGGSLVLLFSSAPGMITAVPEGGRISPAAAPDIEDCALPGGDGQLHAGIPTPDGFAPSRGTVSALTLFIDFPDAEAEISTEERFAEFFPGTGEHFAASSYGRLDYRPAPVHRWLRMPRPFEDYGIDRGVGWHPGDPRGYNRLMRDIVAAAEDAGKSGAQVDFAAHDLVNVLAAPNAGPSALEKVLSVSFPGRPLIATAGGRLSNVSFIWSRQPGESPYRVLVHENGHAFGLPDLYWTGAGSAPELTGHWDVMEQDWGPSNDVMAWQKWKLEWLTDEQVTCVTGPGTTEHLIAPLVAGRPGAEPAPEEETDEETEKENTATDAPSADDTQTPAEAAAADDTQTPAEADPPAERARRTVGGGDTRLVAIPTGPRQALTLEVRTRGGLDAAVCRPGVLITRVDTAARSGEGPLRVIDATPGSAGCQRAPDPQVTAGLTDAAHLPGDSFRDEGDRVEVEILDAERGGHHRVRVTRW